MEFFRSYFLKSAHLFNYDFTNVKWSRYSKNKLYVTEIEPWCTKSCWVELIKLMKIEGVICLLLTALNSFWQIMIFRK